MFRYLCMVFLLVTGSAANAAADPRATSMTMNPMIREERMVTEPHVDDLKKVHAATIALFEAIQIGDVAGTREALDKGANVNATHGTLNATPLIDAVERGDVTIVRILVNIPGINLAYQDAYELTALDYAENYRPKDGEAANPPREKIYRLLNRIRMEKMAEEAGDRK